MSCGRWSPKPAAAVIDRVRCCVPFCRRTKKASPDLVLTEAGVIDFEAEWICPNHWPAVPAQSRRLHGLAKRRAKKRGTIRAIRLGSRLWERCKRQAIEAAGGI